MRFLFRDTVVNLQAIHPQRSVVVEDSPVEELEGALEAANAACASEFSAS